MTHEEMYSFIKINIRDHGQHIVGVAPTDDDPDDTNMFMYTIGNYESGLPELLLIADIQDGFVSILNFLGATQRERGTPFSHGEVVEYADFLKLLMVNAGHSGKDEYAIQAGEYYDTEEYEVMQVLLSDENGRFPGDPDCLPPFSEQIVLSVTH